MTRLYTPAIAFTDWMTRMATLLNKKSSMVELIRNRKYSLAWLCKSICSFPDFVISVSSVHSAMCAYLHTVDPQSCVDDLFIFYFAPLQELCHCSCGGVFFFLQIYTINDMLLGRRQQLEFKHVRVWRRETLLSLKSRTSHLKHIILL